MKNKKNIFYVIAISLVFLLGLNFRFKSYLFERSLWLDESSLFFTTYELKYSELFGGLKYFQSAPPIFLALAKFIISNFGIKELAVRFVPFISSILAIPVFYFFSKVFLKKKWSLLLANFLFAINMQIIYYSQEFKQYSTDVLIVMLLFLILYKIRIKNITPKKILLYMGVTTIFPLISIPSYFVIAGWFLRELYRCKKENILKLFVMQIPVFIMTVLYYFFALRIQREAILRCSEHFWSNGFLTFNFENNMNILMTNFKFFFEPCHFVYMQITLFVVGLILIMRKFKRGAYASLLFLFLTIVVCSLLKIYPISVRVVLFLIPLLIVVMAKSLDYISTKNKLYSLVIVSIFIMAFCNYNFHYLDVCNNVEYHTYKFVNPKSLFKNLVSLYKPGDTVFVYGPANPEYKYYKLYYNFEPSNEVIISRDQGNSFNFMKNIVSEVDNCWFFYSFDWSVTRLSGLKILKKAVSESPVKKIHEFQFGISSMLFTQKN